jgi:hypothetical protein
MSDGHYVTGEFDGYSCDELLVAGVGSYLTDADIVSASSRVVPIADG